MIEYCTNIPLKMGAAIVATGLFFAVFYALWRFCSRRRWAWGWAIAVPLVLFCVQQVCFARDIPFMDDFHMTLDYLSMPFLGRIQHLCDYNGEHRLAIPRLMSELVNLLPGQFNFIVLMNVGNLFLIAYAIMFGLRISRAMGILFFIPFVFLSLDLANYENTLFALDAVQHYPVQFFALASLVCVCRCGWRWIMASVLFAVAATLSSGAGVLVWPALLFVVWKRCWWMQGKEEGSSFSTRLRNLLTDRTVWALALSAAVTLAFYFQNFAAAAQANFAALTSRGLLPTHNSLWDKIDYVITACGAVVPVHAIAFPIGLVVVAMGIYILANLNRVKDDAILGLAAFELGISISGAVFRSKFGGGGIALMLRYAIISFSLIVSVSYLTASLVPKKILNGFRTLAWMAFAGSVLVNFSLLVVCWELLENRTFCLEDGIRMNTPSARNAKRPEYVRVLENKDVLKRAEELGIWRLK